MQQLKAAMTSFILSYLMLKSSKLIHSLSEIHQIMKSSNPFIFTRLAEG
jgi:hypothetical protein